jgi:threonine/homoserine/homoserine lactone efflux protein
MLAAAGANAGVWRSLPCLLGVTTGTGLMMFVLPLGLGSLVLGMPLVLAVLHWSGAAVLLWLAWKIATAGRVESKPGREPVGYLGAAIVQWVNPKSWLVSTSAASTFLSAEGGSPVVQSAFLGGLFVLAALPGCFLWLVSGATLQRMLTSERRLRAFNVTMGALLALSIALIVT